jgi:hypothetical protein
MGKSPEELKKERANRDAVKPEIQKESAETAKEKVSSVAPERTQDIKTTSAGEAVLAARDSMGDNTENVTNNNSSSVLNNSNSNVSPESIVNNNSSSSNYAAPSSATPNVLRREVKPKSITNSNTSKSSSVTNNVVNAPTTVNNSTGSSGGGKNSARPFDSSFARIQDNKFGRYSFA